MAASEKWPGDDICWSKMPAGIPAPDPESSEILIIRRSGSSAGWRIRINNVQVGYISIICHWLSQEGSDRQCSFQAPGEVEGVYNQPCCGTARLERARLPGGVRQKAGCWPGAWMFARDPARFDLCGLLTGADVEIDTIMLY